MKVLCLFYQKWLIFLFGYSFSVCLEFTFLLFFAHLTYFILFFCSRGRPPYPLIEGMSQDELDHILGSLDSYQIKNKTSLTLNPIIGYLKEFQDQQESGLTSFELPKRVKYSDWFPEASVTSNVSTILSREDTFSFVEFQAPYEITKHLNTHSIIIKIFALIEIQ